MLPRVSQPEVQRQVRQQRADIDSLYELVAGVDQKVDNLDEKVTALDEKLDHLLGELSGQLAEVLRQLGDR
jgi:peptidoglycan hydrolase CwlO-like protein